MSQKPFPIPVVPAAENAPPEDLATSACSSGEPYALMVLEDSMEPEFHHGEIIVIEPEGVARDGSFVIAFVKDDYYFRQLVKHPEGWMLKPLNPVYENIPIDSLDVVKGIIVLKKTPGKRSEQKSYA